MITANTKDGSRIPKIRIILVAEIDLGEIRVKETKSKKITAESFTVKKAPLSTLPPIKTIFSILVIARI
jgi:hypothetical protein